MNKSRAQRVMEEIRSEKPVLNDANYMSQLERQRDRLFAAIAADTAGQVWHGPLWINKHQSFPQFLECPSRIEVYTKKEEAPIYLGYTADLVPCYVVEMEEK